MRRVRRSLTWGVVAAVASCGLTGLEAWPLTGWRLFSERRHPVTSRYEVRAVDPAGFEAAIPFARLPHGYSGSNPLLEGMAGQSPSQREGVCAAWARATTAYTGTPVTEVRVYQVTEDLRQGSRRTEVAWTCGRSST